MEWLEPLGTISAWLALLAGLGMPLVSAQNVQLLPTAASSSFLRALSPVLFSLRHKVFVFPPRLP